MTLLSYLSSEHPADSVPPLAGDTRLQSLGFSAWREALADAADSEAAEARAWSETAAGQRLLAAMFGNSPFLTGVAVREWRFLTRLVTEGADKAIGSVLAETAGSPERGTEAELMRRLRLARRHNALMVAVADLTGVWQLDQQMQALSGFAEAALEGVLRHLFADAAARGALPAGTAPEGAGFIMLGLGKLGGGELNYSSDIDLILLYDPARAPPLSGDALHGLYNRFARDLVRILDERTGDGYVFRTDLRLRPDPRSTPLVMSTEAALRYYESVGQNWERAALIKARPVAGDRTAGERFLTELQPYVWRKNLDFAAIADIHSIKRQIQAHRGGARIAVNGHDIKIGRGGIREIEFFAQTQQLIWGGRQRKLRVRATCEALTRLAAAGQIDAAARDTLIDDYRFLRRIEHRLQMVDDQQTHRLPADAAGIARLAVFLGYATAQEFTTALLGHLTSVEKFYAELFEGAPSLAGPGNLVFTGADDEPETLATLEQMGFADASTVAAMVRDWHHGRMKATHSQRAREILTELVPGMLRTFGETAAPDAALRRFDEFLARLPAGVQLFSLFQANPSLLRLVADIMSEAPLLAEDLARRPALLDAVLSPDFFAPPPEPAALAGDLAALLAGSRDFEDTLDLCRRWANERRFQIGVQLLHCNLDGASSGAALADIAEAALGALVPAVTADLARIHGEVPGGEFAVLAMGRLGSREMTLSSDLDLILIYDAPVDSEGSDGERPLAVSAYYGRLTQRLIGAITAPTAEGRLYDVDMRLRPSGSSGPIATSLEAFALYQRQSAWTWEHMALTRARPVTGSKGLRQRLDAAVAAALAAPRDPARLVGDVAEMRQRIADEHPRPAPWDLRNRRGGLVDIEFIAQYLMLREAAQNPAVLRRDIAAAIAALGAADVLPPQVAQRLADAVSLLRNIRALLPLLFDGVPEPEALGGPPGATLARCAGAIDFSRLDADITAACAAVSECYDTVIARPAHAAGRSKTTAGTKKPERKGGVAR